MFEYNTYNVNGKIVQAFSARGARAKAWQMVKNNPGAWERKDFLFNAPTSIVGNGRRETPGRTNMPCWDSSAAQPAQR